MPFRWRGRRKLGRSLDDKSTLCGRYLPWGMYPGRRATLNPANSSDNGCNTTRQLFAGLTKPSGDSLQAV